MNQIMTEFLSVVMTKKMILLLKIVVLRTFVLHLHQQLLTIVVPTKLLLMIASLPLFERCLVTPAFFLILVLLILILVLPLLNLELPLLNLELHLLTVDLLHVGPLLMIVI
jgi:hypothetical protein